jgi:DNA-binding GntR family transcriptional regulator
MPLNTWKMRLLKAKILEIVESAEEPVTIDDIARQLGINWHLARALLLELDAYAELKAIKTERGWAFVPLNWEEMPHVQANRRADRGATRREGG